MNSGFRSSTMHVRGVCAFAPSPTSLQGLLKWRLVQVARRPALSALSASAVPAASQHLQAFEVPQVLRFIEAGAESIWKGAISSESRVHAWQLTREVPIVGLVSCPWHRDRWSFRWCGVFAESVLGQKTPSTVGSRHRVFHRRDLCSHGPRKGDICCNDDNSGGAAQSLRATHATDPRSTAMTTCR